MEGARKTGQEKRVEIYWEKKNKWAINLAAWDFPKDQCLIVFQDSISQEPSSQTAFPLGSVPASQQAWCLWCLPAHSVFTGCWPLCSLSTHSPRLLLTHLVFLLWVQPSYLLRHHHPPPPWLSHPGTLLNTSRQDSTWPFFRERRVSVRDEGSSVKWHSPPISHWGPAVYFWPSPWAFRRP